MMSGRREEERYGVTKVRSSGRGQKEGETVCRRALGRVARGLVERRSKRS